jgi:hypothetical protein
MVIITLKFNVITKFSKDVQILVDVLYQEFCQLGQSSKKRVKVSQKPSVQVIFDQSQSLKSINGCLDPIKHNAQGIALFLDLKESRSFIIHEILK